MKHRMSFELKTPLSNEALCKVLHQRLLAEGYASKSADMGKQTYTRNYGFGTRTTFDFFGGARGFGQCPILLTVSLIPTPQDMTIRFHYLIHSHVGMKRTKPYCEEEFNGFRDHLAQWVPTGPDENKDEQPRHAALEK